MTDLLERLAAANPVPECEKPAIDDVWRKISELAAESHADRPRRWGRLPRRAIPVVAALAVPTSVVVAIALPLLGVHHGRSRPAAIGASHVRSALDPAAQRIAAQQLGGRVGAVVALDPRTGAIKAIYGNATRGGRESGAVSGGPSPLGPAVGDEFPPGAAFEIVTTTAALDSGHFRPDSRLAGPSPLNVAGTPMRNVGNQSFAPISLTQALSYSADTIFARVGQAVGRRVMTDYMRRFGFYSPLPLRSAAGQLPASGVRLAGGLVLPTSGQVDLARLAVGQGELTVTPLQMAMVAAAVADGGKLMNPHLEAIEPTLYRRVMKPSTARELTQMMRDVVSHGTATAAALRGVQIAGKTGAAAVEAPGSRYTDPWFIGFAPANHPEVAIAVVLKHVQGGFGGTDAAPIAAKVIKQLLAEHH